jgi:FLVCR family MFS transporter 7
LPEIGQTRWRWLMIFLYALQTIMNAVLWITFAPVTSAAATYFSTSTTVINMLSLMFMIVYLPGSIFAAWIFNRYGLRTGMFVGSFCNLLSAGVRYLAIGANHRARSAGLAIIVIGQFIGGMAQPFFTNSPAKLAGEWFPTDERNVATTIAAMCNPLGIALGTFDLVGLTVMNILDLVYCVHVCCFLCGIVDLFLKWLIQGKCYRPSVWSTRPLQTSSRCCWCS